MPPFSNPRANPRRRENPGNWAVLVGFNVASVRLVRLPVDRGHSGTNSRFFLGDMPISSFLHYVNYLYLILIRWDMEPAELDGRHLHPVRPGLYPFRARRISGIA